MSDSKISSLTELTSIATDDEFVIVDKSDTSMAVSGTTKKVKTSSIIDTDGTLAGNLDSKVASQKAVALRTILPEGFLLNGKIAVTVSSNNLTVAIKTLSGTDPSATNPVQIRINGSMRSITSALSVTKNAGTNWFNAGSAELATKEIDYFVYLGYNATDGVVLGFSRIPHGTQYSDFSTTTTNEKYCAISTITNASSTDYYDVIGRFAATLSAGAGYTWSVPTFTASNLIQRPIFESRYLSYVPTWSSLGTQPALGNGTLNGRYKIFGSSIKADVELIMGSTTTYGTLDYSWKVPFTANGDDSNFMFCGSAYANDTGVAYYGGISKLLHSQSTVSINSSATSFNSWFATTPFTFGNTDKINFSIAFEI